MSKRKPKTEVTVMPRMSVESVKAKGIEVAHLIDQGTGIVVNLAATVRDMLQNHLTDMQVFVNAVMSATVEGKHTEEETGNYLRRREMVLRTTLQRASVAVLGEKHPLTLTKKKEKGKLLGYEVGKPNPAKARKTAKTGASTDAEAEIAAEAIANGMTLQGIQILITKFCSGFDLQTIKETRQHINDVFVKLEAEAMKTPPKKK